MTNALNSSRVGNGSSSRKLISTKRDYGSIGDAIGIGGTGMYKSLKLDSGSLKRKIKRIVEEPQHKNRKFGSSSGRSLKKKG